ncbi:MAG: hypothetical protein ACJ8AI_29610 [Rhodopila sp.]
MAWWGIPEGPYLFLPLVGPFRCSGHAWLCG